MVLVNCHYCGKRFDTNMYAAMCPLCGAHYKKKVRIPAWVWAAALVVGCLVAFVSFKAVQEALMTPQEKARLANRQEWKAASKRAADRKGQAALQEAALKSLARDHVKSKMKDPRSAEFRNQKGMCGEVNANNSFGAKTGFTRFIVASGALVVLENDGQMANAEFAKAWNKACL